MQSTARRTARQQVGFYRNAARGSYHAEKESSEAAPQTNKHVG